MLAGCACASVKEHRIIRIDNASFSDITEYFPLIRKVKFFIECGFEIIGYSLNYYITSFIAIAS